MYTAVTGQRANGPVHVESKRVFGSEVESEERSRQEEAVTELLSLLYTPLDSANDLETLRKLSIMLTKCGSHRRVMRAFFKTPPRDMSIFHSGLKVPWQQLQLYRQRFVPQSRPMTMGDCIKPSLGFLCSHAHNIHMIYGCGEESPRAAYERSNEMWYKRSEIFAQLSSGKVRVMLQGTNSLWKLNKRTSVFLKYELPALKRNALVTHIVTVNSETLEEKVLFARLPEGSSGSVFKQMFRTMKARRIVLPDIDEHEYGQDSE